MDIRHPGRKTPPLARSPLIGRAREIAVVSALLLRPDTPLVTLLGPGGVGKTRLALHIANTLAPTFADGVRFVDLAPIRDPDLVLPTIAQALDENSARTLSHRRLLLLLDNCEHLIAAAPQLAALLGDAPHITILATSREVLRIADEQIVPVAPLELPEPDRQIAVDQLAEIAAVHLFVERAKAADARFSLTSANAAAVTEIVRQVDGLPLAIELAAAQIRHLAPAMLRDRLEQRLPLLRNGWRDRPPRLQTMRDAIAWSYDLLDPDERALFRGLSVFAGGCTLRGAELAGQALDPPRDGHRLFDLVSALVDKSLLQHDPATNRYRMLETIREFAAGQLAARGESDRAHTALVAYAGAIAGEKWPARFLPDYSAWLRQLETEQANLRATLAWLDATGRRDAMAQLSATLSWFWYDHGHLLEGRHWLERALAADDRVTADDRVRMSLALGMILLPLDELEEAQQVLNAGLEIAEASGSAIETARALLILGGLAIAAGRSADAMPLLDRALQLSRSAGDAADVMAVAYAVLANLGVASCELGRFEEAGRYHETALAGQRALGSARGEALSLVDLGCLARDQGDAATAVRWYNDGLRIAWELGEKRAIADALTGLACASASNGRMERAARLFAAADRVRAQAGITRQVPLDQTASNRGRSAARTALGDMRFNQIWEECQTRPLDQLIAEALDEPAEIASPASISLTRREMEVLRLLIEGETDRAIGDALFINVRTVENHVARIFAKLGVRTRTAAATRAISAGLVLPLAE